MQILEDIKTNEIEIYNFPDYNEFDFDKDDANERTFYKSLIPFAIISSNQISVDSNGRRRRVRKYKWGEIDSELIMLNWISNLINLKQKNDLRPFKTVENLEYSDFVAMKKLIIKYHLLDMIERTNIVHYEKYRLSKLDSIEDCNSKPKRYFILIPSI